MIIIADDLTGANDTAVQYKKYGFSTIVKVVHGAKDECGFCKDYDILSINADTRPLSSEKAYEKVYAITKQVSDDSMDCLYKKIDSVLRGNPGSELDAVMDAMSCRLAIVAPSFPETGRLIEDGILSVGERSINVVEVFSKGMKRKVQGIHLDTVRCGAEKLMAHIVLHQTEGKEVFVLDACTDEDLKIIKDASKLIEGKKVLCGSAGLAKQLSMDRAAEKQGGAAHPGMEDKNRVVMVVIGSRTNVTALQVERASEYYGVPIIKVETGKIIDGMQQAETDRCAKQLLQETEKGQDLVIVAVDSLFEEYALVLKNSDEEYGQALNIVEALGNIVKRVYGEISPHSIICSGGDTSFQICKAFDAWGIELMDEIMPGVPVGKMVGGQADSTLIVTKSGGFGAEDVMIRIIEYLRSD